MASSPAPIKHSLAETLKPYRLVFAVAALYAVAAFSSPAQAYEAASVAVKTFAGVAPIVIAVFAALGLMQVFVDKQAMARHLGERAGLPALLLAAAAGTILVGPVFVIFPLLKSMRDHGTSLSIITTTLTAWAVKLTMVPLEAGFLGWKFSIARMVLTLSAAVVMGPLMGRLMRNESRADICKTEPKVA
ncbi:MAG: permease [Coriobacteriia bacterium]|nr:permease [Coriobacteriia bacterium]MBN2822352.1 permease [Coriobacteriia bacterium]